MHEIWPFPKRTLSDESSGLRSACVASFSPWPLRWNPALAPPTPFAYDASGRQIRYTDPEGQSTSYTYDDRDRRTAIAYPDGRVHQFIYGIRRQTDREITPGGTTITYSYGPDAGLTGIAFAPAPGVAPTAPVALFRDALRRPVVMTQGAITLMRTYDSSLRLTSASCRGQTATLTYDDAAGTALMTYPDGRSDMLTLDPLGRLLSITLQTAGAELVRYTYRGPRRVLGNGVATSFDYDDQRLKKSFSISGDICPNRLFGPCPCRFQLDQVI